MEETKNIKNYRPIIIISVVSKIMVKLIAGYIRIELENEVGIIRGNKVFWAELTFPLQMYLIREDDWTLCSPMSQKPVPN